MFVFKAAVVGTGEFGEEIAGAIRAAGVQSCMSSGVLEGWATPTS